MLKQVYNGRKPSKEKLVEMWGIRVHDSYNLFIIKVLFNLPSFLEQELELFAIFLA